MHVGVDGNGGGDRAIALISIAAALPETAFAEIQALPAVEQVVTFEL
jgi:hypothetical protein